MFRPRSQVPPRIPPDQGHLGEPRAGARRRKHDIQDDQEPRDADQVHQLGFRRLFRPEQPPSVPSRLGLHGCRAGPGRKDDPENGCAEPFLAVSLRFGIEPFLFRRSQRDRAGQDQKQQEAAQSGNQRHLGPVVVHARLRDCRRDIAVIHIAEILEITLPVHPDEPEIVAARERPVGIPEFGGSPADLGLFRGIDAGMAVFPAEHHHESPAEHIRGEGVRQFRRPQQHPGNLVVQADLQQAAVPRNGRLLPGRVPLLGVQVVPVGNIDRIPLRILLCEIVVVYAEVLDLLAIRAVVRLNDAVVHPPVQ